MTNTQEKMSDASPEVVAYHLLMQVLEAEGRIGTEKSKLSRNLILDAYSDCLEAVKGGRKRAPKTQPA